MKENSTKNLEIKQKLIPKKDSPQFDNYDFMIGDEVAVAIRP